MNKELNELNEALVGLRNKVNESVQIAQDTLYKVRQVINKSSLNGTLTMLESDIMFRRLLEKFHG